MKQALLDHLSAVGQSLLRLAGDPTGRIVAVSGRSWRVADRLPED